LLQEILLTELIAIDPQLKNRVLLLTAETTGKSLELEESFEQNKIVAGLAYPMMQCGGDSVLLLYYSMTDADFTVMYTVLY